MEDRTPEVHIGEVDTEIVVTENVGPLGPAEVRRIVAIVVAQVREAMRRDAERERDTKIGRGVFDGGV